MTPSEIVESHLKHLTRRLVARSPLLFFRPDGRGLKMDVTDLFPGLRDLPINAPSPPVPRNHCANPDQLLAKVARGEEGMVAFPDGDISKNALGRCIRMRRENRDYLRTTGQWGLSLAWPLIHIPPPEGRVNPLCAPLLFWKVDIGIDRNERRATIQSVEKDPVFNFILNSRLQFDYGVSLKWREDGLEADDFPTLIRRVKEILGIWRECEKEEFSEDTPWLRAFSKDALPSHPAILPCAVLGMANFERHALFGELGELKVKVRDDEDCGLLGDFLRSGMAADNSIKCDEPAENEKWLVEQSDTSQTAAVCQARESNVLLLEGPPGTGKSQTIVNMIADALRKRESVVVACHQRAALDVVLKRLKGVKLEDLVVRIIQPKKDRDEVIGRIVAIGDEMPLLLQSQHAQQRGEKREELSASIETSEERCDSRTLGFVGDRAALFSVRGHLRARIERLRQKTNFFPFGRRHAEFMKCLGDRISHPVNIDIANDLVDKAQMFSDGWRECGYSKNPWKAIPDNWDIGRIPALRDDFSELVEAASSLADNGNILSPNVLMLAGHPLMSAHYSSLVRGGRKNSVQDFLRMVRDTRHAFMAAELPVADIWRCFMNGDSDIYARHLRAIQQIEIVQTVTRFRRENPALALVSDCFEENPENWPEILEAALCGLCHGKLPRMIPLPDHTQSRKNLKDSLREKTKKDRADVRAQFLNRLSARNTLQGHGLLRQKPGGGRPMTRLRDIYGTNVGFKSIRDIFPALLTKPDSASQLLQLKPGIVDLLIVDEASQMFTADALPLLYRAKRAVICGDSMQMPPSDFFMLTQDDDEDNDAGNFPDGDGEDEGVSFGEAPAEGRFELLKATEHLVVQGSPERRKLEVHYRSRPDELIAFSNHAFYDGKLHAAPGNYAPPSFMGNRAIRVEHIPGQFKSGINHEEIRTTIKILREIWFSPEGCVSAGQQPLSVGVIVFNTKQSAALDDEIFAECERDVEFRAAYEAAENLKIDGEDVGFFVRSAEHVQGDERDIIILATTYGSDRQNYGPISQKEKGRRRLNVAVTRAKVGMIVLTSLDIDRIANAGDGPGEKENSPERWFLWKYMRYARAVSNGDREGAAEILRSLNPVYNPRPIGQEPESDFERQVGDFLEENGYAVDFQVGESGFRIDIGVKVDKDASRYLCGIECDGRFWHSGWRARANDIWRQEILESKGWKIRRIWSDEWFDGGDQVKAKIITDLAKLKEQCG